MTSQSHHPIRRSALSLAAAAMLGAGSADPAAAASCTWNATAGNWAAIVNWLNCATGNGNPTGVPGSSDTANIGATGVVTVDNSGGQAALHLNNAGQIDINAFVLSLAGGGSTTNSGTLNVGAGPIPNNAALQVGAGHNVDNTGGFINISADSVLNQFGSTITGGTITTTGTGKVVAFSSGSNFLSNVTLNGILDLATNANSREQIINGATLNGSINVANGGILGLNSASTGGGGNQTLNGTATINLNDAAARLSIEGNGSTTLGLSLIHI